MSFSHTNAVKPILYIYLGIFFMAMLLVVPGCSPGPEDWQPAPGPLTTRWTQQVSPENVLSEYPRPQIVRSEWLNLNGLWEFAVTAMDAPKPSEFDETILVPFPVESSLSGLMRKVKETERIWYRREFEIPEDWQGRRLLLHFGAVDWEAQVYINSKEVGRHRGGYDAFGFDITDSLKTKGRQELVVAVWDPSSGGSQTVGKQSSQPRGIFYTPSSGIWRTVWLEPVPENYIREIRMIPDVDQEFLQLTVFAAGKTGAESSEAEIRITATAEGKLMGEGEGRPGETIFVPISEVRLWSPDSPFLYDLQISLGTGGQALTDRVKSYFAMRKISLGKDAAGITRLLLNNAFVFQLGPLDQGFWPDGLYTAPTDEALRYDVEVMKQMGFNMVRKHVKVEPDRWYYWCDKLGLMVWQDMPNGKNDTPAAQQQFEQELKSVILGLFNHPCIVMWVPFNEGWGQYDSERITTWLRELDPSRLINHASGWHDRGVSDVHDVHSYPDPKSPEPEPDRAAVLGEFGGLGFNVAGHSWNQEGWGYDLLADKEGLARRYENLFQQLLPLITEPGLSAAVYTQISDIETENNGLMTYDREIIKIEPETAALAHQGYLPPQVLYPADIFVDKVEIAFACVRPGAEIHYTLDGSEPTKESALYAGPILIEETTTINIRAFWEEDISSQVNSFNLHKISPRSGEVGGMGEPGLATTLYLGEWDRLPDFTRLSPHRTFIHPIFSLTGTEKEENFGLKFEGMITIPQTGVYVFYTLSDDGSRLFIGDQLVVENDGLHGIKEAQGAVALEAGIHPVRVIYFQKRGGKGLDVQFQGPGVQKQSIPAESLSYRAR